MTFVGSIPEEINAEGHLIMSSMTGGNGSEFSFPRRGLPREVAEKLGDMMERMVGMFAPVLAEALIEEDDEK